MFINPPWRGHIFIDINIVNVGWHCPSNFLILRHDHNHNCWHDLWGYIKIKSQLSEAISLPFYHNSLKRPEGSADSDLEISPTQIEDSNVATLLLPFPEFLSTNVHVGRIRTYKVIQLSVVHDQSHFSLILLYYCHQRNQSSSQPQLFLRVQHKPAICYQELKFIFIFAPDVLWNRVFSHLICQWSQCAATRLLPCCSPNACIRWKLCWSQALL